jgi:hypothetical protein
LFGLSKVSTISLNESRIDEQLVQPFSEEEVCHAVFQMEHNKAPVMDGFPAEFYQACWNFIKEDLMALFTEFHDGSLPLYSLNFGTIILIPKCREAMSIQ